MDKKITIVDFEGTKKEVAIKDFKNVIAITVSVKSGDETLLVIYKDGKTDYFDSSDCRFMGFDDGTYNLPLDKIDEFSKGTNSYDKQRKFDIG